jgi:hypothetical protein
MYNKHKEVEVMQKIRKNILLSPEENDLINNFADRVGLTFSEFIRKTALEKINKEENVDLLNFLIKNCSYVEEKEQNDFEKMNIDFSDLSGKEFLLDELL